MLLAFQIAQPLAAGVALVMVALCLVLWSRFRKLANPLFWLCLAIAGMALLAADIRFSAPKANAPLVLVVDVSHSHFEQAASEWSALRSAMLALSSESARPVGAVFAGRDVQIVIHPTDEFPLPESFPLVNPDLGCDIGLGIDAAMALEPHAIFVLTDGALPRGNLIASAPRDRTILLEPLPSAQDRLRLLDLDIPETIAPESDLDLGVRFWSRDAAIVRIACDLRNGGSFERLVDARASTEQHARLVIPAASIPERGTLLHGRIRVELVADSPAPAMSQPNSTMSFARRVGDIQNILYLSGSSADMPDALRTFLMSRKDTSLSILDSVESLSAEAVADASLLVLNDVHRDRLPDDGEFIRKAVGEWGTSLLVTGAQQAWGPGAYAGSALAQALPMDPSPQPDSPARHLVLLDASASMHEVISGQSQGQRRFDALTDAASLYLSRLRESDQAKALAFSSDVILGTPAQEFRSMSSSSRADVLARIRTIQPRGGTSVASALDHALACFPPEPERQPANSEQEQRFLLLMTDGTSQESKDVIEARLRELWQRRVATTLVLIAPDIPEWLQLDFSGAPSPGALLTSTDFQKLRETLAQELSARLASLYQERPVPATRQLDAAESPVSIPHWVHVAERTRGSALTLLKRSDESAMPLAARWTYGAGIVSGMAFDCSRLDSALATSESVQRLLAQEVTLLLQRRTDSGPLLLEERAGEHDAQRVLEASLLDFTDASAGSPASLQCSFRLYQPESGRYREVKGVRVGVNRWRASFEAWGEPLLVEGSVQDAAGQVIGRHKRWLIGKAHPEYYPPHDAFESLAAASESAGMRVQSLDQLEIEDIPLRARRESHSANPILLIFTLICIGCVIWLRR